MAETLSPPLPGHHVPPPQPEKLSFHVPGEHHPKNGTLLGFWVYLMSDCLIFACLFATCWAATMRRARPAPTCSTCRWWR